VYPKGMIQEKQVPAAAGIRTNDFSFASKVPYHLNTVCCGFQKNVAQIFSIPSHSTHFAERTEARVNSW